MVEKITGWKTTCERFVAYLDIMGFRDMVYREKHRTINHKFENLLFGFTVDRHYAEMELDGITELISNKDETRKFFVYPITFSDSIILISIDNSLDSALNILIDIIMTLSKALDNEIPIKGAIAYGEMTANIVNSLYFGRPLIDAFELQKELQLYNCVLHHTTEKQLKKLMLINKLENNLIFNYPTPMKSGLINHYLLDLVTTVDTLGNTPIKSVTKLYSTVSGNPRIYVDNTIRFLNWAKEQKAKRENKKKKS